MEKISYKTTFMVIHILILKFTEGNFNLSGLNLNTSSNYDCSNPNGQSGVCISLYYCPTLLRLFHETSNITDIAKQNFLDQSTCVTGFGPDPFVCCTNQATFMDTSSVIPTTEIGSASLLASPDECAGSNTIYQYGTHLADIKDYHWMALLEYGSGNGTLYYGCQGSLISHRYVLTAAHCERPSIQLIRVRLGEYDLSTDIDCVEDTCVGPVKFVDVEKIIVHSEFNRNNAMYNIALVRLAKYVDYDDSISPICLPSVVGFNGSKTGEGLFSAGYDDHVFKEYGDERDDLPFDTRKYQVNLPIFDHNNCSQLYTLLRYTGVLSDELCAGGNGDLNSLGDAGGALMRQFKVKYLGIIVDNKLNFKEHVDKICAKIAKKINFINRIKHNIDIETLKNIYNTIVLPHFDYCSSVLFMCNEQSIYNLQKLQNRAMRIILRCNRLTSRKIMLSKLNWMCVRQRIYFNAFVFIYKVKNNLMPTYLTRQLSYVHTQQPHLLRNRDHFRIPNLRKISNENHILSKGLKMYNQLPNNLKEETRLNGFKKLCKDYVKNNFDI